MENLKDAIKNNENIFGYTHTEIIEAMKEILNEFEDFHNSTVQGIEDQTDTNKDDISTLQSEMNDVEDDISSAQSDIQDLQNRSSDNEDDIDNIESDISSIQDDISSIQSDIDDLESRMGDAESDIQDLQNRSSDNEDDINDLQDDVSELKGYAHYELIIDGDTSITVGNQDSPITIPIGESRSFIFVMDGWEYLDDEEHIEITDYDDNEITKMNASDLHTIQMTCKNEGDNNIFLSGPSMHGYYDIGENLFKIKTTTDAFKVYELQDGE